MKPSTVWHGHSTRPSLPAGTARKGKENLLRGRRNRLITPPAKRNRAFPTGNALLYISLSYADLIASFTSSAILNNLFAICNSRLLPTNQIVNCDGRVRPGGRTLFLFCPQSSNPWLPAAFHRRMQAVFSKKQTSPKPVFVRQDFGEAVKKEEK